MSLEIPSKTISLSPESDAALFRNQAAKSSKLSQNLRDAQLKVEETQKAAPPSVSVSLSAAGKASLEQFQQANQNPAATDSSEQEAGAVEKPSQLAGEALESTGLENLNIDKIIKQLKQQIKELEQRLSDLQAQPDSEQKLQEQDALISQLNSLRSALLEAQTQQLTGA